MSGQFSPQKYWQTRFSKLEIDASDQKEFFESIRSGAPYPSKHHAVRADHLEWLDLAISPFKGGSLLDVGCGPGFWFPLWKELNLSVTGADFAEVSRDRALAMAKLIEFDIETHLGPASDLPFADNSFDVAVTVMVLIHTPLDKIRAAVSELARVARNVVILEYDYSSMSNLPRHVFDHDYGALLNDLGFRVEIKKTRPRNDGEEVLYVFRAQA